MTEIPGGLQLVRTTAAFTETSTPEGLLRAHRVAEGVWGRVVVAEGVLGFVFEDTAGEPLRATPGEPLAIPPHRPHHVVLDGPVRFAVEFYK
jgi:tellurite resistance-related uncharacterized protein